MKRFIPRSPLAALTFALGLFLGSVVGVSAVNFTMDLTQAEVDIANWKWNKLDPAHTLWSTAQLFGRDQVRTSLLAEWKNQRWMNRLNIVGAATGYFCANTWDGLSQNTKDNTVCIGLLGEVAGCTPCDPAGN